MSNEPERCVVRLRTTAWTDKRGVHFKQSITYLRRQSSGYDLLTEDAIMVGAKEVIAKIVNLHKCEDGVYQVVACNEQRDWETGYVEDYDYRLIAPEPR